MELLAGRGVHLTACVATEYGQSLIPHAPEIQVCAERMDADEMRLFFQRERFDLVVDATHPYAQRVTENLRRACGDVGVEYLRLLRPAAAGAEDGIYVEDAAACAQALAQLHGNVLLTTGSKDLHIYCQNPELRDRLFVRVLPLEESLRICADCGIPSSHVLAMQGPFNAQMNEAMLRSCNARFLVTKDGGDVGGYGAKIDAARCAGAECIIIGRPQEIQQGLNLDEVMERIEARTALTPLKKHLVLAGIGMGNCDTQTQGLQRVLESADCVIGARRMLDAVDCKNKLRFVAVKAEEIEQIIRQCRSCKNFLVLLSGDTGFYSGARALREALADLHPEILPGIGSLQYLCAKLGRGWEDVRCVSLHGRQWDLVREVRQHPAVFALVGGKDGAHNALSSLCDANLGTLEAWVGERLGYPDEQVRSGRVDQLMNAQWDPLSVLLVENPRWGMEPVTHGLPDSEFLRAEVPMTKSEVRSVALSKLALGRRSVVYDVGSGSGSVTVEAARLASDGRVYAIEKKPQAMALTRENVEHFKLKNVVCIEGSAPEAMEGLEAPTHAFIGGSAGNLAEIIHFLCAQNPSVRMVATAVTLDTMAALVEIGKEFDVFEVVQINVSRAQKVGKSQLMTAQNPVYVVTLQNQAPSAGAGQMN